MAATTISYTCKFATVHNPVNIINNQLDIAWKKHDELDDAMINARAHYENLLKQLEYAQLSISIVDNNITMTQDKINELSCVKDEMIAEEDDVENEDEYDYMCDPYVIRTATLDEDYGCKSKDRKVRSNVLSVRDAIMAGKSSKNHKLKPKSSKKDRSKSPEAKKQSKKVKASHM
jgi:hypothetical protein